MTDWHIAEDLLGRFLNAQALPEEARQVVRHLLAGCSGCSELAYRLTSEAAGNWSQDVGSLEQAYEEVFLRACAFATEKERRLVFEKLKSWAQWTALEPLTPQARLALVESDPSFQTFGLCQRLFEASRWPMRGDSAEAVDIAGLAVVIAGRLDPGMIGQERVADLQAAAWANLGNVKRLASDFEGSRHAFHEARRILEQGTGDPLEAAGLLSLESSYMRDVGELETAEAALGEALAIYRRVGDTHQEGRTLLKMGDAIGDVDPERALAYIRKALPLIDRAREPRLDLCAQHDLAWFLNDSGHSEEALAVLEGARPLYRQFPDEWTQLRLHWLEGRIASSLGDLAGAEDIFRQLWEEFRSRDLNHELTLVSIDLAEVLVRRGELERAAELVELSSPILAARGLHRYALAAWLLLQESIT
ncbi:MAG TPA: hypothetical protein VMW27_30615 [Thermoanaerobaculia bacterium]|nr:hypothetical protein [Thermoanaerobaculia bacterium]